MPRLESRRRIPSTPSSRRSSSRRITCSASTSGESEPIASTSSWVELAEAAGLRRLVAECRAPPPELHRLRELVHAVLDVGAADRRRRLGPQRDRAAAEVVEGEHLLADDVGRLADRALEELGVLEDRGLDAAVAGAGEDGGRGRVDPRSPHGLGRQYVERPLRGLEAAGHRSGESSAPARRGTGWWRARRRAS